LTCLGNKYFIAILPIGTQKMAIKKTTVQIDESLLAEAIKTIGAKTQREAIEAGLKYLVQRKNREALTHELGTFDIDLTLEELESLRNAECTLPVRNLHGIFALRKEPVVQWFWWSGSCV